ncbi:MAG: GNAT family N-acetyltransferase [Spirochaetaceae bacterium]|nr:MAG: GNAT family N-acetyltransferase [Spirochaetaceae bacterium]
MEPVELVMVRDDLSELPRYNLPPGFSCRMFQRGDENLWAQIETSAGEFATADRAIGHFHKEFGIHQRELCERCIFIDTGTGESIGTAMAWYGTLLPGGIAGRLHWVGIRKNYQGLGMGKPLVSRAMQLLSTLHDRAYLTTQTSSYAAVKIYLDFGFKPYITDKVQESGWSMMSKRLGFPIIPISYSL